MMPAYPGNEIFQNVVVIGDSIIKVYFSFFVIYGMYCVVRNKDVRMYPLMLILVFNTMLTIITVHSLDYRFGYPTSFLYYYLILYGYFSIYKAKIYIAQKEYLSINFAHGFALICAVFLTVFYNFR
jgi:hypothetical protein